MFRTYCNFTDVISIHTPTKGATVSETIVVSCLIFQSTLPRRERHTKPILAYLDI